MIVGGRCYPAFCCTRSISLNLPRELVTVPWIESGAFKVTWNIRIDALTAVMLVVVNVVSCVVHLYSVTYMSDDAHRARFMSYLSLFTFAMLTSGDSR